jgi:hypothetical protein
MLTEARSSTSCSTTAPARVIDRKPHNGAYDRSPLAVKPCQAESLPPARPTRMTAALLAFISRATALIEAPSSSRCSALARPSSVSTVGRPNFFPSALARACPASVRSISRSLSNCATAGVSMPVEISAEVPVENSPLRFCGEVGCHGARSRQGTRAVARAARGSSLDGFEHRGRWRCFPPLFGRTRGWPSGTRKPMSRHV